MYLIELKLNNYKITSFKISLYFKLIQIICLDHKIKFSLILFYLYLLLTPQYNKYCTSDVSYFTADQTVNVMENSTTQTLPDLPCSISGSTSISFSTANYMTSTVPSWIAIDSVSGVLSVNSPEVSLDTEYDFYINSAVSGVSSPIQKLIKLIITNCAAKN